MGDKLKDELDDQRELTGLLLEELAAARRARKALEAQRDEATVDARAALDKALEPFLTPLAALAETEDKVKAEAEQAIREFDAARKNQLIQGIETLGLSLPIGVTIKWLDTPIVADVTALPSQYTQFVPDMPAIKLVLKHGGLIAGVQVDRKPSIVVASETP